MKHFLSICLFVMAFTLQAQTSVNSPSIFKNGIITGTILDGNLNEPLPYVNIVIRDLNNKIITGGLTKEDGTFYMENIPEGKNKVSIEYLGYKTVSREIEITKATKRIDFGTIKIFEEATSLGEVEITAEVSTIQQKVDRKVINVGKDLTTTGPTASDIMNNLPSVSVDQQSGAISLRGNQNVRVMVDGKLSNIPAAQLLKQIPSTSIKSIELITNPSAKYNPEGMSGIINIVLHKNVKLGFNGSINMGLNVDENAKFNSSVDLNYRNGKINIYGNYGNNIAKNANRGNILRIDDNSQQFFGGLSNTKNHLYKVGVDYYINDKNTVSFFTNQNTFDSKTNSETSVLFYDDEAANQYQTFKNTNDNISGQYNLNYKLDFAKDGHNVELEVDYNDFEQDEDANFYNFGANALSPTRNDLVGTERNRTTINLDYVNPLSEKAKLELGLQARLFETNINFASTGLSFNEAGMLRQTPSTTFDYERNIFSAYATYGKKFEKFTYQIGLRAETVEVNANALETEIETNETTPNPFKNDYFEVYPSLFLTYSPSEKNSYQLSYSRRIDRPGIGQINPIREWSTPLISQFGNPNLLPQFTNSIEANYTRVVKGGSITGGVFYRIIEDEINTAVFVDQTDLSRLILTNDNFDNTSAFGIELSSNYRPTKWWSINASFDLFSQTQTGITERIDVPLENATIDDIIRSEIEVDNVAWNFRAFNNFSVSKTLSFSLFGLYRGKNKGIQFESTPMYFVNVGARQSFAKGKGSISINYNDIFNTMEFGFVGDNPFRQTGNFNWENQNIFLGLNYRFGGGKYRAKSRKNRDNNEKSSGGGFM
ncbi:TonB-dependent receptor [Lacinutrix sp. MedPE-SW]|uniref:TonB-dependent receptor domain-containing protein n=1 Tax=Lacinutrix sp. MedPE-SW TaxID=1860087 RepID=UPI00091B5044|nr:TonB-dependent receptor [Lacinutrix sp. MedPE-SW]OIQ22783.1 MAG: TonB-dependent receptor [Lacinutrix sp. MedPE-SW]